MRDPHMIIVQPHITEKTTRLSYGDPRVKDEKQQLRKYTFIVANDANKIEIKHSIESIYNAGKKEKDLKIEVIKVHTLAVRGKMRRVGNRKPGRRPDRKKAIVTLARGQMLEDYGV